MKYLLILSVCFSTLFAQAQTAKEVDMAQLEAKATEILEGSKGVLADFEGIEAEFTMVIEIPDQE